MFFQKPGKTKQGFRHPKWECFQKTEKTSSRSVCTILTQVSEKLGQWKRAPSFRLCDLFVFTLSLWGFAVCIHKFRVYTLVNFRQGRDTQECDYAKDKARQERNKMFKTHRGGTQDQPGKSQDRTQPREFYLPNTQSQHVANAYVCFHTKGLTTLMVWAWSSKMDMRTSG
jgi:hypothetical protein